MVSSETNTLKPTCAICSKAVAVPGIGERVGEEYVYLCEAHWVEWGASNDSIAVAMKVDPTGELHANAFSKWLKRRKAA